MAIGDIFNLRVQFRNPTTGLTAENSFTFRQELATVFDTPGEDLVQRFDAEVLVLYEGLITSSYGLERKAVYQKPGNLLVYEQTPIGQSGTLSGDPLPPMVCGLISERTATPGRRGRGRTYLPPATESVSAGRGPVQAYVDQMTSLIEALVAMNEENINYARWAWGVWSETDQVFREITFAIPRLIWATQRNRAK
jgi:hypothetical protein